MIIADYCFISAAVLSFLILIVYAVKTKAFIKTAFTSGAVGICSFAALNISGIFTDFTLSVTPYTISVSLVGGLPGVLCLTLAKMLIV